MGVRRHREALGPGMSKPTPSKRVRPILKWQGGKSRMLKELMPLIPAHVCYCEPFAGGLAVLLAKERSKVEVINDINGDLISLYRNLQFHLPALLEELQWFQASRKNLYDFRDQPGLTEIQRAARFLLRNRTSFGGDMSSFGVAKTAGGGVGFNHDKVGDLLGQAHERLNGVVVEHVSYDRCLKLYDSAETCFFIDPPYLNHTAGAYAPWTEDDVINLRKRLDRLQGQFILTIDDSPFNRKTFGDLRLRAVQTRNGACNTRTKPGAKFGELIITAK